jgi:hypothetical protein
MGQFALGRAGPFQPDRALRKRPFLHHGAYVLSFRMEPPLDSPAAPGPDFDPVPLRARRDGWTPERQRLFIRILRETGSVGRACRAAGRTRAGAYRLYGRPDAESFRRAWDAAAAAARTARVGRAPPQILPHPRVPEAARPLLAQMSEVRVRARSGSGSWTVSTSSTLSTSGKTLDTRGGGFPWRGQ